MAGSAGRGLALAVLVVLAGCGSLGASDRTVTESAAVTPAPVPEGGETPTPVQRRVDFPGVADGVMRDGRAVAATHQRHLRNTSYRVVTNLTVRVSDGTLLRRNGTVHVAPGGERYLLDRETLRTQLTGGQTAGFERLQIYRNGSGGWYRRIASREVGYGPIDELNLSDDRSRASDIGRLLDAFTVVVEDGRFGPQRQYNAVELALTNPNALDTPARIDAPTDGRLVVAMDVAGVVRFYQVGYVTRLSGERVRVLRTVRFEDIGRTTVAESDWVAEARTSGTPTETTGDEQP